MSKNKSALLVYAGALLVVLCFFLPWISVSFMGVSFSVSGMTAASGSGASGMEGLGSSMGSSPLLYLVPVLGVVAAALAYVGVKKMGSKNVGILEIILGGVPLVYGIFKLMQANQELSKTSKALSDLGSLGGTGAGTEMSLNIMNMIGIGLWGTGLGFVLIIVGGVMMLKETGQPAQPTQPAPPVQPVA